MSTIDVVVVDPGKYPELVSVELTKDMEMSVEWSSDRKYSPYKLAKKLIHEYSGEDDFLVQRVKDRGYSTISMYIDEECRVKNQTANRNFITTDNQMLPLAGRVIMIPDMYRDGDIIIPVGFDLDGVYGRELRDFMQRNNDDGSGPIVYLSQEDSNLSYGEGWEAYSGNEELAEFLNNVFKNMKNGGGI